MITILRLKKVAWWLAAGVIPTIFWEKFLSPVWQWAAQHISNLIAHLSTQYENGLYISAAAVDLGSLGVARSQYLIASLVLLVGASLPAIWAIRMREGPPVRWRQIVRPDVALLIVTFVLLGTQLSGLFRTTASTAIKYRALQSLEILRSSIGEEQYQKYRSQFHSMQRKADFDLLADALREQAKRANLSVPIDQQVGL